VAFRLLQSAAHTVLPENKQNNTMRYKINLYPLDSEPIFGERETMKEVLECFRENLTSIHHCDVIDTESNYEVVLTYTLEVPVR
jgi:hypothetical protein